MKKSKHILDLGDMFEPTHSSYEYEEEVDWITWALFGGLLVLFAIGLLIANHYGIAVRL